MTDDVFAYSTVKRRLLENYIDNSAGNFATAALRSKECKRLADFFICFILRLYSNSTVFLYYLVFGRDMLISTAG